MASLLSLQVAEALLHMQVRLGMLKADDVPSLQAPPAPAVVGGAIMLGTGAPLPQLVRCGFVYWYLTTVVVWRGCGRRKVWSGFKDRTISVSVP